VRSNSTVTDVAIVEPPHRGDRDRRADEKPLHRLIALFWEESPCGPRPRPGLGLGLGIGFGFGSRVWL
jgi:hypothetical protein